MFRVFARSRACTALLLAALALQAHAQEFNPQGDLTLAQAIEGAMHSNPDLKASAYELNAAQARILQAGVMPNPDLALDLEDFGGTGEVSGVRELQTTLSLSQVIELGGKRARRVDAANSDRDLVGVEQRARELDVLAEVTRRFVDVVAAQERVRLTQSTVDLIERTSEAIGKRVEAARSPTAELSRARISVIRAQLDLTQAQTTLESARQSLASMWGATQAQFGNAQANLFALPPLESLQSLSDQLERSPDLMRFASESRLRDAELRLAQAAARPNLTLGLGLRRYESTNDTALVAGFSMGLPVFDRNQGNIAEASVRRTQTQALEQAARIRAQATLYALYKQVQVSRRQLQMLKDEALPQAQAALDQTQ
ncbi:MAG TPA: TolC family protein, partial [Steroidobacteraceae bacterium]|nr:TolC family protein [Steroidobacteraceae bacterium]